MTFGLDQSGSANKTGWYTENWINDTLDLPLVSESGLKFEYRSAAPALFGPIIEHASGIPVAEFARNYLFEPLNISHYQWYVFPDGSVMTAGGLQMRPRDMAKFGYLILSGGQWHGKKILSEKWIDTSTSAHVSAGTYDYGYYWWPGKFKKGKRQFQLRRNSIACQHNLVDSCGREVMPAFTTSQTVYRQIIPSEYNRKYSSRPACPHRLR